MIEDMSLTPSALNSFPISEALAILAVRNLPWAITYQAPVFGKNFIFSKIHFAWSPGLNSHNYVVYFNRISAPPSLLQLQFVENLPTDFVEGLFCWVVTRSGPSPQPHSKLLSRWNKIFAVPIPNLSIQSDFLTNVFVFTWIMTICQKPTDVHIISGP